MIKRFRNLQISNKILFGLSILIVVNFVVAFRIYTATNQTTNSLIVTRDVRVPSANISSEAQKNLLSMQSEVRGYLVRGEASNIENYGRDQRDFDANLAQLTELSTRWEDAGDIARLESVQALYFEWTPVVNTLFRLHEDPRANQPALLYEETIVQATYNELLAEVDAVLDDEDAGDVEQQDMALVHNLRASILAIQINVHGYAATTSADFKVGYTEQLEVNETTWVSITANLDAYQPDQREALDRIEALRLQYIEETDDVVNLAERPDAFQDLFLFDTIVEPQTSQMLILLDEIAVSQRVQLETVVANDSDTLSNALAQTVGLGALALNVGILFTVVAQRLIAFPIVRLIDTAEEISDGNLAARAKVDSTDEVGRLGETLNTMTGRLSNTIERLEVMVNVSRNMIEARSTQEITNSFFDNLCPESIQAGYLVLFEYDTNQEISDITLDAVWPPERTSNLSSRLLEGNWKSLEIDEMRRYDTLPAPYSKLFQRPVGPVASYPLWLQARQLGVLIVEANQQVGFSENDLELLRQNANQFAIAIDNQVLFQAITRRAQDLATAIEQAHEANQAKDRFLATISHELRTPLNGILGYAKILEQRIEDRQNLERLRIIQDSGLQLMTLIEDVLDISKMEAGKFELTPKAFDFDDFMEKLLFYGQLRVEGRPERSFSYESPDDLPPYLYADDKRLRQVLLNLLSNAFKFTPAGTVSLIVEHKPSSLEIDAENMKPVTMIFTVADQGIGISEEDLATIFQPFEQSGEQHFRKKGTGLGLAISKDLAEAMNGNIRVESKLGEGSRFIVTVEVGASWAADLVLDDEEEEEKAPEPVLERAVNEGMQGIDAPALDGTVLDEMLELVAQGEITELRQKVQRMIKEMPDYEPYFARLQQSVDRFDEDGIMRVLNTAKKA